jgi:RNA polymerase sigma factor (TIGR02999 family)
LQIERSSLEDVKTQPDITALLEKWGGGEESALEELVPLLYNELRRMAGNYLRRERHELILQPTALINEVFLRLIDQPEIKWQSRAHFFGIAARLMRQILIDRVRARQAAKRGGVHYSLSLSKADHIAGRQSVDLLALNHALHKLDKLDPLQVRIVELRFFGGLTIEESSEVLSLSHATLERRWKMARAWLRCELGA